MTLYSISITRHTELEGWGGGSVCVCVCVCVWWLLHKATNLFFVFDSFELICRSLKQASQWKSNHIISGFVGMYYVQLKLVLSEWTCARRVNNLVILVHSCIFCPVDKLWKLLCMERVKDCFGSFDANNDAHPFLMFNISVLTMDIHIS